MILCEFMWIGLTLVLIVRSNLCLILLYPLTYFWLSRVKIWVVRTEVQFFPVIIERICCAYILCLLSYILYVYLVHI